MGISAGRLRHRITIQSRINTQGSNGDVLPPSFVDFATNVPAEFRFLSAREFVAGGTDQSQVVARVTIRNMQGLKPDMRILFRNVYYDPHGFLPDGESGLVYITIPVSQSLSQNP